MNPVRNSSRWDSNLSGALNPTGIVLKSDPAAEQRGIISNGVKDYLEDIEKKIAMKKSMEKMISLLEEELRLSEERLKRIEEYEREDYLYYQPFRDKRTGKWVPVATPFHEEKRRLKAKIDSIQAEIKSIQERLSELMRSL